MNSYAYSNFMEKLSTNSKFINIIMDNLSIPYQSDGLLVFILGVLQGLHILNYL